MKDGNGNMDAGEYTPDGPAQPAISNWSVDDSGDIWSASPAGAPAIRHYLFKGLDGKGNPVYYGTNNAPCPNPGPDPPRCVEEFQTPPEFGAPSSYCNATGDPCTGVMRAYYVPSSHTMYLSGFPPALPKLPAENQYTTLGREIARYDNWDQNCPTGTERSCAPVWSITDLPYQMTSPYDNVARSMDLTCGRLLVGIQAVAPDQFFPEVRVYDTANGALLDRRRPGPEVAGKSGQNINPAGMNAFQRSNGEILVFMEELLNAKTLMYRVTAPPCGP